MKNVSKKTWIALSVVLFAVTAIIAYKKPVHEKKAHIVVDRLVNQLVCSATPFKIEMKRKGAGDDYTLFFSR